MEEMEKQMRETLAKFYGEEEIDVTESDNTNLDAVPTSATISFRSGATRDTQMSFVIRRAMIDPEAEVIPYEESNPEM